ncbi:MAG: UTP--glucose-1-phosphate uridylyltransferase [Patescibacteria group bacterium]|nr:UTP--glucose-1-phosphate uridylyltransferase [Patescibacteria group bacterium]
MMDNDRPIKKAVLPVAGFGTRFLPATRAQPKEMLPIVDKPVVQHIVEECVASGIDEIIFVTGRNKRAIEDHFDYIPELEDLLVRKGMFSEIQEFEKLREKINITYVRQDKQMGNGHALLCTKKLLRDHEPFIFCNADDIIFSQTPAIKQMIAQYEKNQIVQEMVGVIEVPAEQVEKCGIIEPARFEYSKEQELPVVFEVAAIIEKPSVFEAPSRYANPGRYILTPDIFKALERTETGIGGELWISDAFNNLKKQKPIYACQIQGKRFDCGNKLEYLKAVVEFGKHHPQIGEEFNQWLKSLAEKEKLIEQQSL